MADTTQRRNRVFKSLHRPLTYLGIERTTFFLVCLAAVICFNLFDSLLAGLVIFVGGALFGYWVTNTDPAFFRILGNSQRLKVRYDAAKQQVPNVEIR